MKFRTKGNVRSFLLADGALHIRILHQGNWDTPVPGILAQAGLDDKGRVVQETILVLSKTTKENLITVLDDLERKET
jgi:hypothetical protein